MPLPTPDQDHLERRYSEATQLRVFRAADSLQPMFVGYAIVFNKLSLNLGGFRERIAPEAIDRTLRENVDVRALLDHDPAKVLGRLSAGTLRIKPDTHGVRVEIDAPNTSYARDALESVERRDISGMSFGFRTMPDGDDWDESDEMLIRTVTDMIVREFSVVTFPAYEQTDVQVAQRSMARWKAQPYRPSLAMNRARQRQAEW